MAKPDRHFVNVFSAVIGVLVAIALVLIGISRLVDSGPKGARDTADPLMQASAHERIKPVGQVAVAGEDNSGLAIKQIAVPIAGSAAAPSAVIPTDGKSVFDLACSACHGTGIAGAPRIGDKAAWASRIAQGNATLEKHALWLQGQRGTHVTIEGHCDERGTAEYNLALGEQRARAARDYLASLCISAERMRTVSYGKGTANGPAALIRASQSMELWDEEMRADVHGVGIFTLPEMELPFGEMQGVVDEIERVAYEVVGREVHCSLHRGGEGSLPVRRGNLVEERGSRRRRIGSGQAVVREELRGKSG